MRKFIVNTLATIFCLSFLLFLWIMTGCATGETIYNYPGAAERRYTPVANPHYSPYNFKAFSGNSCGKGGRR